MVKALSTEFSNLIAIEASDWTDFLTNSGSGSLIYSESSFKTNS